MPNKTRPYCTPPTIASDTGNNHKKSDTNPHHLHRCYGHSPLTLQGLQQLDCPSPCSGKEYYKDSTCLDQKCSTWSAKPHGGHLFLLAPTNKMLLYDTRGDWKQTLVAANEHPAIRVLQIERMTEEHMPYIVICYCFPRAFGRARTMAEKGDVLLGFFARGTTKHCELVGRRIPKIIHGDETDRCQYQAPVSCCGLRPLTSSTSRTEQQEHSVNKNWSEEATVTICLVTKARTPLWSIHFVPSVVLPVRTHQHHKSRANLRASYKTVSRSPSIRCSHCVEP